MTRRPPRSTRTDTLFPYTTLFRSLDNELIEACQSAIEGGTPIRLERTVRNVNRTVGAMLSGEIARRYGHRGLAPDTIRIEFSGVAGQSFGADRKSTRLNSSP